MQITHIASNGFYSVSVDEVRNRLHIFLAGTWMKVDQIPNWLDDVRSGLRLVSTGFSVLTNSTKLRGLLRLDLIVNAQQLILGATPGKVALLYAPKGVVAKALMEAAAEDSGLVAKLFSDLMEAEAYLDN